MSKNPRFDYSTLSDETSKIVKEHATAISQQLRQSSAGVIAIGQSLIDVKAVFDRGVFRNWIKVEFEWSETTAYIYIQIARRFGNAECAPMIQLEAMRQLAKRRVPQAAVDAAIAIAASGQFVSTREAERLVAMHSPMRPSVSPPAPSSPSIRTVDLLQQKARFLNTVKQFHGVARLVASKAMSHDERMRLSESLKRIAAQLRSMHTQSDEAPVLVGTSNSI